LNSTEYEFTAAVLLKIPLEKKQPSQVSCKNKILASKPELNGQNHIQCIEVDIMPSVVHS